MQERNSVKGMDSVSGRPRFVIRGRFCGDKTFPSLNQYLAEVGRNPKLGGSFKRQYVMIATNAIRRDLRGFKTSRPVILHFAFYEPKKGNKRDRDNIFGLAAKFIIDAMRDCKVFPDDNPNYLVNFTHEFYYTDGEPYISVEIEELMG